MLNKEAIEVRLSVFKKAVESINKLGDLSDSEMQQLPAVIKAFEQTITKWKETIEKRQCKKDRS